MESVRRCDKNQRKKGGFSGKWNYARGLLIHCQIISKQPISHGDCGCEVFSFEKSFQEVGSGHFFWSIPSLLAHSGLRLCTTSFCFCCVVLKGVEIFRNSTVSTIDINF